MTDMTYEEAYKLARVANVRLTKELAAARAEVERLRGLVEASFREGWCTAGAVKEVFASEAWPRSDAKAALDAGEGKP